MNDDSTEARKSAQQAMCSGWTELQRIPSASYRVAVDLVRRRTARLQAAYEDVRPPVNPAMDESRLPAQLVGLSSVRFPSSSSRSPMTTLAPSWANIRDQSSYPAAAPWREAPVSISSRGVFSNSGAATKSSISMPSGSLMYSPFVSPWSPKPAISTLLSSTTW